MPRLLNQLVYSGGMWMWSDNVICDTATATKLKLYLKHYH